MNLRRCRRLIAEAIEKTRPNVQGLTILTEAANGAYAITPVIAAAAGAERVLCLGRDSRFGTREEAWRQVCALRDAVVPAARIEMLADRNDPRLAGVDVVTNLGFVRPIDRLLLGRLGRFAAVSLMWETWEFRPDDVDLAACRELGVPVLGTNEHLPALRIFDYIGILAIQLLLALRCEVFAANVVVLGQGEFADVVVKTVRAAGADVQSFDTARRISTSDPRLQAAVGGADVLLLVDHHRRDMIVGEGADVPPSWLWKQNSALGIAHVCGGIDVQQTAQAGLALVPVHVARPGHMSVTPADLGPKPVIDLHAAGLRVGAALSHARRAGHHGLAAESAVVANDDFAQGWEMAAKNVTGKPAGLSTECARKHD